MAAALFPTWAVPSTVADAASAASTADFKAGPRLDFDVGDAVTDGMGRAIMDDGYGTWAQWCEKTFLTQRARHPIYSAAYGIDWDGVLGLSNAAIRRGAIESEIRAALGRDPRTKEVRDLAMTQSGDVLTIALTVVPAAGAPLSLERAVSVG